MRLLHARDLSFKEFIGDNIPEYIIISHRWGDDEVSFQDFEAHRSEFLAERRPGYGWTKIKRACEIARRWHFEWVWMDTCCIDKKSSAELSEAINSMFDWYRSSAECVVFLPDVHDTDDLGVGTEYCYYQAEYDQGHQIKDDLHDKFVPFDADQVKSSVWFTRAWTLQELLAPSSLTFFNSGFDPIGSIQAMEFVDIVPSDQDFVTLISSASSIPYGYLLAQSLEGASIAQRLQWASRRQATRREDVAYSLLGIFGVNMPLLYGEGNKAFSRLQQEIIKHSDDESIFAWQSYETGPNLGALAPNIAAFSESGHIRRDIDYSTKLQHHSRCDVTNKAVRMTLWLHKETLQAALKARAGHVSLLIPLHCENQGYNRPSLLVTAYPASTYGADSHGADLYSELPRTLYGCRYAIVLTRRAPEYLVWPRFSGKTVRAGFKLMVDGWFPSLKPAPGWDLTTGDGEPGEIELQLEIRI